MEPSNWMKLESKIASLLGTKNVAKCRYTALNQIIANNFIFSYNFSYQKVCNYINLKCKQ